MNILGGTRTDWTSVACTVFAGLFVWSAMLVAMWFDRGAADTAGVVF
jgi:hypothetical protein